MASPGKRKRVQQPVEEHDSDSDAPEEVSNAASKHQVIENARAARAATRQLQGKRAASTAAAATAVEGDEAETGGSEPVETDKATVSGRQPGEDDQEDLLPLDIIEQLAGKDR
jgi:hypothetical protein